MSSLRILTLALGIVSVCGVQLTPSGGDAATLDVLPGGTGTYPTIEAAVTAAVDGDVIVLGPGIFAGPGNRDVSFRGKSLTIRSATGDPSTVTIACEGTPGTPHRAFRLASGEGPTTLIEGLTVSGGYGSAAGIIAAGAILIANGAHPVIRDCVFTGNAAGMSWDHAGGAVYVDEQSSATFERCTFSGNSAFFGGAVGVNHFSQASFVDCRFLDNVAGRGGAIWGNSVDKTGCLFARNSAQQGGAVWGNGYNIDRSVRCTYVGNSAPEGGAIYSQTGYGDPVLIEDTIIAGSPEGAAVWFSPGVVVQLSCCDLFGNAGGDWVGALAPQVDRDGNFSADPCFCDAANDDFHLCADSWCLSGRHPWGCQQLVGAYGGGCDACACGGPVATERKSLGSVRSLFR